MRYCIITFCFGHYYYDEVNVFIGDISKIENPPNVFVLTDKPSRIDRYPFVRVINIKVFGYVMENSSCYSKFDFDVKKFLFKIALESGYEKFIIADADSRITRGFKEDVEKSFVCPNRINVLHKQSFIKEYRNNPQYGLRVDFYQKYFNKKLSNNQLTNAGDDNLLACCIDRSKLKLFVKNLYELVELKNTLQLNNYSGITQEIYFSSILSDVPFAHNGWLGRFIHSDHKNYEERISYLDSLKKTKLTI